MVLSMKKEEKKLGDFESNRLLSNLEHGTAGRI
jgi:hypothetical protein